jgi:cytochrome c oxidase subunit 1
MVAFLKKKNYLNYDFSIKSWLLTVDHKRIGILYLISVTFFFAVGGFFAALIRLELLTPAGDLFQSETYNRLFTLHGITMIFFFLIPSVPAILGNFLLPIMIGAKDMAFPKLNLASWYVYILGASFAVLAMLFGGVDTGWTFYAPYSSTYSNSAVALTAVGAFIAGFSSIFTGINFIVTVHKMRAPGLTWFRLPLFVWAHYAAGLIMVLATPVLAATLFLLFLERVFGLGIFNPALGGDPILFQHLFWFYSHPAVYIMILPSLGVMSEIIAAFTKKRIFGYEFVAISSLSIAVLGFLVWGHHMFVSSQSMYTGMVFFFSKFSRSYSIGC